MPDRDSLQWAASVLRDYVFILEAASRYFIVAFQDHDGDRILDPGEPVGIHGRPEPIVVDPEEQLEGQEITLDERTAPPSGLGTDLPRPWASRAGVGAEARRFGWLSV